MYTLQLRQHFFNRPSFNSLTPLAKLLLCSFTDKMMKYDVGLLNIYDQNQLLE